MHQAFSNFQEGIKRAREIGGLHAAVKALTTQAIDPSDLLRAQVVMAVSILDFFIHEITLLGMIEILKGTRPATEAFKKYRISAKIFTTNLTNMVQFFEEDIREKHSYLSFQQPEKIADAIRLISEKSLWKSVSLQLSRSENDIKTELKLITERRNKIAHEADLDPSFPGTRWPIQPHDCDKLINFIEEIGGAIYLEIK